MNLNDLNEWDHRATLAINGSESLFWDNVMSIITNTFAWTLLMVVLLVIIFRNNTLKRGFTILVVMALMMVFADMICSGLVKPTVARWRPTQDPQLMYLIDVVDDYRGGRFGFFSGHACNSFSMAMFLSWLFRYGKLTIVLFVWSSITTFTRLYLGVHFLGDILVGLTCGCLFGSFFYFFLSRLLKNTDEVKLISVQFTPTGYLKSDLNMFMAVIFFNYICIAVLAVYNGIS